MQKLMTTTALSRHAEKLFSALEACGPGWHSRSEMAAQLSKSRLTSYDAAALDLLVESGRVKAERHEIEGPISLRWEYKIHSDE